MGKDTAHTVEEFIAAIKTSAGIKSTIAKRLGVSRPTVDAYLERWKTAKDAYLAEKANVDDAAQSVVINDIVSNRNVETAKWWLRMKCHDEFSPREAQELSGPGDGPITHEIIVRRGKNIHRPNRPAPSTDEGTEGSETV